MKKLLIILSLLLIPAISFGAVYIDLDAVSSGDGSCGSPYNSVDDISWSLSEDYYFKTGTTETNEFPRITVGGTSEDHMTLGSYTETAGPTCTPDEPGASITKPRITNNDENDDVLTIGATDGDVDYVDVYNLDFRGPSTSDTSYAAIRIRPEGAGNTVDYLTIRYCNISTMTYGIRVLPKTSGASNNGTIEYCTLFGDGTAGYDGNGISFDYAYIDTWTVQYNTIDSYGHACMYSIGDNITFNYNHCKDTNNCNDTCIDVNPGAANNIAGWNYSEKAEGFQIYAAPGAIFHHNTINCGAGASGGPCDNTDAGAFNITPYTEGTLTDVKVYNNNIYGWMTGDPNIKIITAEGDVGSIEGMVIANNATSGGEYFIQVIDGANIIDPTDITVNNNMAYDFSANYSYVEGTTRATAALFNSEGDMTASGNLDTEPEWSGAASNEFWPSSASSNLWQSGDNTGTTYDVYLLETTDFSTTPPTIYTQEESTHHIGAYTLTGSNTADQGVTFTGVQR